MSEVQEAVLITISVCVPLTSLFMLFIMALLRASKESDYSPPAQQSNDKKIERIVITFGDDYPKNLDDRKTWWKGTYNGEYYRGCISTLTSFDSVEVTSAIRLLSRYALENFNQKVKRDNNV